MTRIRRRSSRDHRHGELTTPQHFELTLGPKSRSAFEDEDDAREAWEANRHALLERYAFTLHDAGWRPDAFWHFEAGVGPEWAEDNDPDNPYHDRRLRWLYEHDAFLPGELAQMERRANRDPQGYAAAWRVVSRLKAKGGVHDRS